MGWLRDWTNKESKVKEKIKRTKSEKIIFGIMFVFLCIYAGTFIFAYGTTILNSFKDPWDYALGDTFGLPKKWLFSNYAAVFTTLYVNGTNFWGMIINSLWQDITPTILTMASTMMASYAYSKYKFPGRKIIYFLAIVLLTLSFPGSMHTSYKLHAKLRLINTPLFFINATAGLGTNFIVFCGFWRSIDWAYAEAGYIDGASEWKVFTKIMVPQALPLVGIFFLLSFVNMWGDATQCMIYLPKYPNIAFGMYEYQFRMERNMNYPVYFAALMITAIPSLILFISFQDLIMRGMNIGGLKG